MGEKEFETYELESAAPKLSADDITKSVAMKHGLLSADLRGPSRLKHIQTARIEVYKALRAQGWSYPAIGLYFHRDHTTVMTTLKDHGGE